MQSLTVAKGIVVKSIIRVIALIALLWPSLSPMFVDAQTRARTHPTIESKIDAYLKPYLELNGFSGSILIAKGGRVIFSKGYGMANFELNVPNTPQTKFHIGSVSKTFTATAIMILQARGKLNVRDPLAKYIPDYPNGDRI